MASHHMEIAALGRPFTLGMLYDARSDELIPGLTLWDEKTLKANTSEEPQQTSGSEVSASDSVESKSSMLDISASMKLSFLGGLIEVGGSAKYLSDTKQFKNQSRVTFEYKATTSFKQLSMLDLLSLDQKQTDMIEKGGATHVVTGIVYGVKAFFVFDSEKLDATSVKEVQGNMEAMIKSIPSFDVEGKAEIKLTKEQKDLAKKFSCKFLGDLLLQSNPATFEEAVKTYVDLPKLLGNHGESCVPQRVWLMPLKQLEPKAAEVKVRISDDLVMKVQDVVEDFEEIRMRCEDALTDRVIENFPQIRKQLSRFRNMCDEYASKHLKILGEKLPSIRGGQEKESSLAKIFDDRNKTPFSQENLSKWLDHKEREINVIRSCVDIMEGTSIIPNQSQLHSEVLAVGDALCFVFTSLESDDPTLDVMDTYLKTPVARLTDDCPWYYSDKVWSNMREKAKAFQDLAKVLKNNSRFRFLIAAVANQKYKGAAVYHYKDGILATEDFSKPDVAPVNQIKDRKDLIWYTCDVTLDPDTANRALTLSEGNRKALYENPQSYPDLPQRFDVRPQVLGTEGLTGRWYWEVDWGSGCDGVVYVGVCYKRMARKGNGANSIIGSNDMSWCLIHNWDSGRNILQAAHSNQLVPLGNIPHTGCNRLGVFLDWPAGNLSFFDVSSDTLSLLYTYRAMFTEPVYPAFCIWKKSNSVDLSPAQ